MKYEHDSRLLPSSSRLVRSYRLEIQRLVSWNQPRQRAACVWTTGENVYVYHESGILKWRTRSLPGSVASFVVPVLVCSARCARVPEGCWIRRAILRGSLSSRVRSVRRPVDDQPATLRLAKNHRAVMAHCRSERLVSTEQDAKCCSRRQHRTRHRLAQRGYRNLRKTTPDCSQARRATGTRGLSASPRVLPTASGRDRKLYRVCKPLVHPSTSAPFPAPRAACSSEGNGVASLCCHACAVPFRRVRLQVGETTQRPREATVLLCSWTLLLVDAKVGPDESGQLRCIETRKELGLVCVIRCRTDSTSADKHYRTDTVRAIVLCCE